MPQLIVVDADRCDSPQQPFEKFETPLIAVCTGPPEPGTAADALADQVMFTLTEARTRDPRLVPVESIDAAISDIRATVTANPIATAICDDVLRVNSPDVGTRRGLTAESLAYSTLQAGPEFARWLAAQKPRVRHEQDDAVLIDRTDNTLTITFNRPDRHNAFSNALRAELIDALTIVIADPAITDVVLTGNGRSFCSGGDLREFGLFTDPAHSHLARTRHSPALLLDAVVGRLGPRMHARVHGAVLGSGIEMAAYCGRLTARPDTVFGLPELRLGLIPGAGGTVSIPRRIGRWRTAYLAVSGRQIDAATALDWGLIDDIIGR
ncbi:enoyl-CoA hydratase/isomerase family protein [Gordonia hydrophobica]